MRVYETREEMELLDFVQHAGPNGVTLMEPRNREIAGELWSRGVLVAGVLERLPNGYRWLHKTSDALDLLAGLLSSRWKLTDEAELLYVLQRAEETD